MGGRGAVLACVFLLGSPVLFVVFASSDLPPSLLDSWFCCQSVWVLWLDSDEIVNRSAGLRRCLRSAASSASVLLPGTACLCLLILSSTSQPCPVLISSALASLCWTLQVSSTKCCSLPLLLVECCLWSSYVNSSECLLLLVWEQPLRLHSSG